MIRTVEPEILDSLPHDHPDARSNRRDLVRINNLMGNHRWLGRMARRHLRPGMRVLEPGAGDGRLAGAIAAAVPGLDYTALDPCPRPPDLSPEIRWQACRVADYRNLGDADVVVANLILHQFEDGELRRLGDGLRRGRARIVLACEPARGRWPLQLIRLGRAIGFHPTTIHDGCVSVRAGFRGDELPRLLALDPARWRWRCRSGPFGAYRMAAFRT